MTAIFSAAPEVGDVFVFGSNQEGRHGKGAAKFARERWGARYGVGEGFTGRSYALPTKRTPYQGLKLHELAVFVDRFLTRSRECPNHRFLLTRIGCGLSAFGSGTTGFSPGFHEDEVAALFVTAPPNVVSVDEKGEVVGPASEWLQRFQAGLSSAANA